MYSTPTNETRHNGTRVVEYCSASDYDMTIIPSGFLLTYITRFYPYPYPSCSGAKWALTGSQRDSLRLQKSAAMHTLEISNGATEMTSWLEMAQPSSSNQSFGSDEGCWLIGPKLET